MSTPAARAKTALLHVLYPEYKNAKLHQLKLPKDISPAAISGATYQRYRDLPNSVKFRLHLSRANVLFGSGVTSLLRYSPFVHALDLSIMVLPVDATQWANHFPILLPALYQGAYKLDKKELYEYILECSGEATIGHKGFMPAGFYDVHTANHVRTGIAPLAPFYVVENKPSARDPTVNELTRTRIAFAGRAGNLEREIPRSVGQINASFDHLRCAFMYYTAASPNDRAEMDNLMYERESKAIRYVNDSSNYHYFILNPAYLNNTSNDARTGDSHKLGLTNTYSYVRLAKVSLLKYMIWESQKEDCVRNMPDRGPELVAHVLTEAEGKPPLPLADDYVFQLMPSAGKDMIYQILMDYNIISSSVENPSFTFDEAHGSDHAFADHAFADFVSKINPLVSTMRSDGVDELLYQMQGYWVRLETGISSREKRHARKEYIKKQETTRMQNRTDIKHVCKRPDQAAQDAKVAQLTQLRDQREASGGRFGGGAGAAAMPMMLPAAGAQYANLEQLQDFLGIPRHAQYIPQAMPSPAVEPQGGAAYSPSAAVPSPMSTSSPPIHLPSPLPVTPSPPIHLPSPLPVTSSPPIHLPSPLPVTPAVVERSPSLMQVQPMQGQQIQGQPVYTGTPTRPPISPDRPPTANLANASSSGTPNPPVPSPLTPPFTPVVNTPAVNPVRRGRGRPPRITPAPTPVIQQQPQANQLSMATASSPPVLPPLSPSLLAALAAGTTQENATTPPQE